MRRTKSSPQHRPWAGLAWSRAILRFGSCLGLCVGLVAGSALGGPVPPSTAAAPPVPVNATDLASQPTETADGDQDDHKLMLVFDSSGSMDDPDKSGTSKIDAAKQAFGDLVSDLPDDVQVGLRVYGATVYDSDDPAACTDSQLAVPVDTLDDAQRDAMRNEIDGWRPYGETPIAYSLREAAEDLGETGQRTILLVSDGEERCDPDPCETAKEISGLGIDVKIDVVGMGVPEPAREQLRCIADAGNGTFFETDSSEELTVGLDRLATRAFRPFKVDGQPVTGAVGDTDDDPPVLTPGQYVDTAPATDGDPKRYRLRRTLPGSTLHVGVSARPAPGQTVAVLRLDIATTEGWSCGHGVGTETSFARTNPIVTAAVISLDKTDPESDCNRAPELTLAIEQIGRPGETGDDLADGPIEIILVEEPPVEDASTLPEPADSYQAWEGLGEPEDWADVTPGASFSDAPIVEPGGYGTTLFPGEVQFYRIPVDWGEHLRVQVTVPEPKRELIDQIGELPGVDVKLIGPTRGNAESDTIGPGSQTLLFPDRDSEAYSMTLEVRYENRNGHGPPHYATALPGEYYLAVSLGADTAAPGETYLVPYRVAVDVVGEPGAGAPGYADGEGLLGPGVGGSAAAAPAGPPVSDTAGADGRRTAMAESSLRDRFAAAGIAAAICGLLLVGVVVFRRRHHRHRAEHARAGL